jgi:hypothetical protein
MGTGHGEKMTRRQEQAIAALLEHSTICAAATAVGVHECTLRAWLKQPHFAREYRERRRQVVEQAVTRLQNLTAAAGEALKKNLTCGHAPTEVRAAVAVMELSLKAVEVGDLAQRIAELEALVQGTNESVPSKA